MSAEVDEAEAGPPPPACRACDHCHLATAGGKKIKVCKGCHAAHYCSVECQQAAWAAHKAACKKARKQQREEAKRRREAAAAAAAAKSCPLNDFEEDPD